MNADSKAENSQSHQQCDSYLQKLRMLVSPTAAGPVPVTEDQVLSIVALRRGRDATLGSELFSDPAWDILLELYAAQLGSRQVGLPEIARLINIPESIAERWVSTLERQGLVVTGAAATATGHSRIGLSAQCTAALSRIVGYWASAFRSM